MMTIFDNWENGKEGIK